jgi:hypothetical protein
MWSSSSPSSRLRGSRRSTSTAWTHKDWDLWRREVFAPEEQLIVPEALPEPVAGLDNIIAWVSAPTGDQQSVHHGHMPIIDITPESSATGIWAMEDRLYRTKAHPLEDGSS